MPTQIPPPRVQRRGAGHWLSAIAVLGLGATLALGGCVAYPEYGGGYSGPTAYPLVVPFPTMGWGYPGRGWHGRGEHGGHGEHDD